MYGHSPFWASWILLAIPLGLTLRYYDKPVKIAEEEVDEMICPNCGEDEDTICYDEYLSKQRRYCESCDSYYWVYYSLKVRKIELEKRR